MTKELGIIESNNTINSSRLETSGKDIMATNDGDNIFADMMLFMENPTTRQIYDKYISHPYESETFLSFCWLYRLIETECDRIGFNCTPFQKVAILQKCMMDGKMVSLLYKKYNNSKHPEMRKRLSEKRKQTFLKRVENTI